jgi:A/G-specific adenine glycosylase
VLIAQRPPEGVWGGLWEFPNAELKRGESPQRVLARLLREGFGLEVEVGEVAARIRHGIMNQRIELTAYRCTVRRGRTKARKHVAAKWVRPDELDNRPLPAPHGKIAQEVRGAARATACRPATDDTKLEFSAGRARETGCFPKERVARDVRRKQTGKEARRT